MKYYYNLYLSESLRDRKEDIIKKLNKKKVMLNRYLIVLTANAANHLEFYDSVLLTQKIFKKPELLVVGIADGYHGALELVEKITQDVYNKTNETNIRQYILECQREFEEGME